MTGEILMVLWLFFAEPRHTIGPPLSAGWWRVAPMSAAACERVGLGLRHPAACLPLGVQPDWPLSVEIRRP